MPRNRQRVRLEAGPKLDLREMPMKANSAFKVTWTWSSGFTATLTTQMHDRRGTMGIRHGDREQVIDLWGQARHLGGVQWYAVCPRTGHNALVLWKPPGSPIFASRHAWKRQVAYSSQFQDPTTRAWQAMRRVSRRLGSTDPDDYELPDKPKGMRWATYDRLVARYDAADAALDQQIVGTVGRLLRRYGRMPGITG